MTKVKTRKRRYKAEKRPNTRLISLEHPVALMLSVFAVMAVLSAIALIFFRQHIQQMPDSHIVIVSHDKSRQTLPTRAHTVGELLQKMDLSLDEGDVVEPAADTEIVEDNFRVNVYRARPVLIVDGSSKIYALSAATTPRSVAAQSGVDVYPEDKISAKPVENFLKDMAIGSQVEIERATPVNLNLYGTPVQIRSHARTVGELLAEKNVQVTADDTVTPDIGAALAPNTLVFVTRAGTQVETVSEEIPLATRYVADNTLSFGATAVRQKGSAGKKLVTYQIQLVNGKEVNRTKIQEVVAEPAVEQIVARGQAVDVSGDKTAWMAGAGIAPSDYGFVNYIISRESGWCPTKWQGQVGYCPAYYEEKYSPSAGVGFGLCQSTPAIKMSSAGEDWRTNPITQLKWCSGYASRYGGWGGSYQFWVAHGWW